MEDRGIHAYSIIIAKNCRVCGSRNVFVGRAPEIGGAFRIFGTVYALVVTYWIYFSPWRSVPMLWCQLRYTRFP